MTATASLASRLSDQFADDVRRHPTVTYCPRDSPLEISVITSNNNQAVATICLLALVSTASPVSTAQDGSRKGDQVETSFYIPVERQLEGWTVVVDPQLVAKEHKVTGDQALQALANHLQRIKYIVPQDRLQALRKLRIWVELENPRLSNMQYHPDRGWLVAHNHDPRLVKHVHIPRAKRLFDPKMWAKHPYVVLHELAHSYHDQVLGFDQPDIVAAYREAKEAGIYDNVLLYTGRKERHYALSNHKEYFAESTEAYLGVNDFYPFVRAELNEHDPRMFSLMRQVWGRIE